MNEYSFEIAGGLCIVVFFAWVFTYFTARFCQWIWSWVDDSEIPKRNIIISKLAKMQGWQERGGFWLYEKGKEKSDGEGIIMPVIFLTSIMPVIIYLGIVFYSVTLFIVSGLLIAFLARFARRSKKLFDLHVKDKSAHK